MVVNWPEIGIQTALIILLLAMAAAYLRYRVVPRLKHHAGEWAGAAIGRFWQKLMEDAQNEGEGGVPGSSEIAVGGVKFDVGAVRELVGLAPQILEVIKMIQSLGFLGGGGGGGSMGKHPFQK